MDQSNLSAEKWSELKEQGSVFVLILRLRSSSSSSELGQVKYISTVFVLDPS